jgi:hypothetical protein
MAHFYELYVAISGINFITFPEQVRYQLPSAFALNVVHWVMALTAVDRLVYVTAPILYCSNKNFYFLSSNKM